MIGVRVAELHEVGLRLLGLLFEGLLLVEFLLDEHLLEGLVLLGLLDTGTSELLLFPKIKPKFVGLDRAKEATLERNPSQDGPSRFRRSMSTRRVSQRPRGPSTDEQDMRRIWGGEEVCQENFIGLYKVCT